MALVVFILFFLSTTIAEYVEINREIQSFMERGTLVEVDELNKIKYYEVPRRNGEIDKPSFTEYDGDKYAFAGSYGDMFVTQESPFFHSPDIPLAYEFVSFWWGGHAAIVSDDVDEFLISILREYDNKKFKSINQGDLDLLEKEEKDKIDKLNDEKKPILQALKESLQDKVKDVVISKRLADSAVCLVSGDGLSFEMEKVLANMPNNQEVKAEKILEINANHALFKTLENVYLNNPFELAKYASLLYNQALLIEGFSIENPVEFSNLMCELMIKSAK